MSSRAEPWTPGDLKALRAEPKFSKAMERALGVGKPELMYRMARLVRDRNDIPRQLNEIFDELTKLAA